MNQKETTNILTDKFLTKYKTKQPNWGFNGLGYVVFKRTYARLKEDGKTEDWWETVRRCVEGAQKIGAEYTREEAESLYDKVFNLKCNFAGRMLWQLGTPMVEKLAANSLLNCWMVSINELKAFEFLFENLMLGGGVGFSIRKEDVHELPRIKEGVKITALVTKDADFIIADSRRGWISLLHEVLQAFFVTGKSFTYSTILVRGAGEKISGFGGTASGPTILVEGMTKIASIISNRESKKLRSIDVLDICNIIGSIVVAGNVRRSAQIALGDPDDHYFIRAKNWSLGNIPNTRAMSNNTIYADEYSHISNDLWENGFTLDPNTGTAKGEPYGFFNLPLSQKFGRIKDGPLKDSSLSPVTKDNCVGTNPCVAPETMLLTREGNLKIKDLEGKEVEVWNGKQWSKTTVVKTGESKSLLKIKLYYGKISKGKTDLKHLLNDLTVTKYHKFYLEDGSVVEAQNLKSKDRLIRFEFENGDSAHISVISILDEGRIDDTYCVNEPLEHKAVFNGVLTGQCGEISLSSYECCNLSELYLNNIESEEELIECATLMYKTQKAICALPFLHEETNAIVHKNMRIGLGVTGVCQSLEKVKWLDKCYKELRRFDREWSKKRGWNQSIKISTVKPSGTLSLLAGATPGVHPAYSQYYIRRVRMGSNDQLVKICRDLGYHVEYIVAFDGKEDHSTVVVEFPCEAGDKALLAKDVSALKQLELVKTLQSEWADNAVSVTVYYKPEELEGIKKWMSENYEKNIKSVSFLLHSGHGFKQAPYESITKEQYDEIRKGVKPLSSIQENIEGASLDLLECASGACPIK